MSRTWVSARAHWYSWTIASAKLAAPSPMAIASGLKTPRIPLAMKRRVLWWSSASVCWKPPIARSAATRNAAWEPMMSGAKPPL